MEFSDWITQKYVEWRGDAVGHSKTIAEFARMFGASQPLMSQWMKAKEKGGKIPRQHKYVNALVRVYGQEVYEVLGLEVAEEETPEDKIPSSLRKRLAAAEREIAKALADQNIDPESPAAESVVVEVMERHGFIFIK